MSKKLTADDLLALVTKADTNVTDAMERWQAAKAKLNTDFPALSDAGDDVGIAKLRKAVRDSLADFEDARDSHARFQLELHKAQQAEADAQIASRVEDAKRKALMWQHDVETLQELLTKVSEQYDKCCASGLSFREALPEPTGESELTMLWSPMVLGQCAQLHLYAATSGRFPARTMVSPFQASQGPRMSDRARECSQRALSKQPKFEQRPTPPEAA